MLIKRKVKHVREKIRRKGRGSIGKEGGGGDDKGVSRDG